MPARQGRCTDFGNCGAADKKEVVEVPQGADFDCKECGRALSEVEKSAKHQLPTKPLLVALSLLMTAGIGVFGFTRLINGQGGIGASGGDAFMRLAGSSTIGDKLAPALVEAYLVQKGAVGVTVAPPPSAYAERRTVKANLPGVGPVVVQIETRGSGTAFTALANGDADVGMASRKIKDDEARSLSSLGDMTAHSSERALGLAGIAISAHPSNPLDSISIGQISDIFSGRASNWSHVGGQNRDINIYARDDKSGTYETFSGLVLKGAQLAPRAQRFESSEALAKAVAHDANGVGFADLTHIGSAKPVAVSEKGAMPLLPTKFTVATEDYPLSRRLYLYTPANSQNMHVHEFATFALSRPGQDVVNRFFVGQNLGDDPQRAPQPIDPSRQHGAPAEYTRLTRDATRLGTNFRFRTGSYVLDNKAIEDVRRVAEDIEHRVYTGDRIMLFGFADSTGGHSPNMPLSQRRAEEVAAGFRKYGITPEMSRGFGIDMPVASNDTPEGREKNRRVEIWLKK
jgi:phosphate transport system substrate-binding protein